MNAPVDLVDTEVVLLITPPVKVTTAPTIGDPSARVTVPAIRPDVANLMSAVTAEPLVRATVVDCFPQPDFEAVTVYVPGGSVENE